LRLGTYPLIQGFTQFPLLWETFGVNLNSQLTGPRTDDDFYTKPSYSGFKFTSALLAPSAGLLFAAVFFRFQPGALASLGRLFRSCFLAAGVNEDIAAKLFAFSSSLSEWASGSTVSQNNSSKATAPEGAHEAGQNDGTTNAEKKDAEAEADAVDEGVSVLALSKLEDDKLMDAYISSIYHNRPSLAGRQSSFFGSMSLEMGAWQSSSSYSSSRSPDKASPGNVTRTILFQSHALDVIPEQLRVPASMRPRGEAATLNPLNTSRLDPKAASEQN
jgi:hypothetical protein